MQLNKETKPRKSSSRGVVAKVLFCYIIVNEFEFQSCYYIHFRTNTIGKGINYYPVGFGFFV